LINWKKTQIFFTLFTSTIPTENELEQLQSSLNKFGSKVTQKDFIEVSFSVLNFLLDGNVV